VLRNASFESFETYNLPMAEAMYTNFTKLTDPLL